MLSSLTRHFNESVFRGPDDEGGSASEDVVDLGGNDGDLSGDADSGDDGGEGGESDKPLSVRDQIKSAMAEASEQPEVKAKDKKTGRFEKTAKPEQAPVAAPVTPTIAAPESLPKEAKAEWDKAPEAIKAAFVKREQDMARGVQELKSRYDLIDQAIAPHTDALRAMNATPADAVHRMFLWFKALAGKPEVAFQELAKSMGVDWARIAGNQPQAPAAPGAAAPTGTAPEIPEPVKQYVGGLENQVKQLSQVVNQIYGGFTGIQNSMNTQNEARTRENLSIWSKDKPHFEEVRQDMAKLIETGVVPLKDGQVDLDTAYERAIYFNPDVRAKVLAAQQQANTQVQQEAVTAATTARQGQVNKARKAAVSLPVSTPGAGNSPTQAKRKPGQRTSVRDSLKEALSSLRDQ
jgi:hypothetical protein